MNKLHEKVSLKNVLTCPSCGHRQTMMMPVNYCERVFRCANCHKEHGEKTGDCCVFCSYGQLDCPLIQNVALRMSHSS